MTFNNFLILQAAWILDESDEDDVGSSDESNDGMVMDDVENGVPSNDYSKTFDLDEDQGSLDLGDYDGETETDSVMVVSLVGNLASIDSFHFFPWVN